MGLFGGGNSTSSTTNQTLNTDRRQVVDGGSLGLSSDSSTINITSLDAGAISDAKEIAVSALTNNATNAGKLLDTAALLFSSQQKALDVSATLANSLAAKTSGTEDAGLATPDTINTKMKATALAAVAAVAALAYFKGK